MSQSPELVDLNGLPSIQQAHRLMGEGTLTPVELVQQCLQRIDNVDAEVQAWVTVDRDAAMAQAVQLSEELDTSDPLPPLYGIPVGVKDIIDVAGLPTRAGSLSSSPSRRGGGEGSCSDPLPASADAPVVAALRQAGAIVLGKTVTTQWACFDPPPTRNPWNTNHTPGGSSSGSAAALAAGMCMAALGSQTGGSIIRPAAYCGVVGLKPTFGAVRTDGVVPVSHHLDHIGPMTRSIDDLQHVWQAICSLSLRERIGEGMSPLNPTDPPLLYLLGDYFADEASTEVADIVIVASHRLFAAGCRIRKTGLPPRFDQIHAAHTIIMAVDAAAYHVGLGFAQHKEQYLPNVRGLIEEGLATPDADYRAALALQEEVRQSWLDWFPADADVLITPSTTTTAPDLTTTGSPAFNSPWSFCGFPAVTLPYGRGESGLPVGLQLVGRPGEEDRLLTAALTLEAILNSDE